MHVEKLTVEHPNWMWFATLTEAPWAEDPEDDRHDGTEALRWDRMMPVLQQLTEQLQHAIRSAQDPTQPITLVARFGDLTADERWTVATFFFDPIDVDPWSSSLFDGRHRTWGAWSVAPDAILPFQSMLLHDESIVDDPTYTAVERQDEYHHDLVQTAAHELPQLPAAVRDRAPAYVATLRLLAAS